MTFRSLCRARTARSLFWPFDNVETPASLFRFFCRLFFSFFLAWAHRLVSKWHVFIFR